MASNLSYAQTLRAIGQSMEGLKFEDFDLSVDAGGFVVKRAAEVGRVKSLRSRSEKLPGIGKKFKSDKVSSDAQYSPQDVQWLDLRGEAQRRKPDQTPDFYRLSQTLRTIGCYVDHSGFRLLALSRNGPRVVLELETAEGRKRVEEHLIPSFQDYFRRLYMERRKRRLSPDL